MLTTVIVAQNAPVESNSEETDGVESMIRAKSFASDEDLVALVLQEDKRSFDRLVERHYGWVYALCSRILRSQHKADDAAQEVFTRALEKLATVQHAAKLAGWLKIIAVNQCRNIIDKDRLYDAFGSEEAVRSPNLNPEQHLITSESRQRVGELIDRLPAKQRLVFVMKYIDQFTYGQIKELTGFSDKQVKSYLQNARRNFEKSWSNRGRKGDGYTARD
jgi:RNA polymerase sigma-70 factor, ECF subfamily